MIFKSLLGLLFCFQLMAKDVPSLTGPIVDSANLFSAGFKEKVGQALSSYHSQTGTQIQILTVDSLEGEPLEAYTIKVVDQWKLGSEKEDRGLLYFIALKDRKMRIEVGQGLEGIVTDAMAGRIIDSASSYYRKRDFDGGTMVIIQNIMDLIGGKTPKLAASKDRKRKVSSPFKLLYLPLLYIFIILLGRGRRRNSSWIYYGGSSSRHNSTGGGWSGGGGGGWSGGGGGFSGGGSSGSW